MGLLPDFGVSEYIAGKLFNAGFQQQQGQSSLGPQQSNFNALLSAVNPVSKAQASEGTAASQTSKQPYLGPPAPTSNYSPTNTSSGGGGGSTGGGGGNPYDNVQPPSGPSEAELNSLYSPIMDFYNNAKSTIQGQQPGLISDAEAQAAASKQLLENQQLSSNELLSNQEAQANQKANRDTAQQRQILQELTQANQQRFGGASSAGLAASELQGREFQRSRFGIQENLANVVQFVNQKKVEVKREFDAAVQKLNTNTQQAINEIKRRIQDKLLEIDGRIGETESAKAAARLDELQRYRNDMYQINLARAQFESELRLQAQANSSQLDTFLSQSTGATNASQDVTNQGLAYASSSIPGVESGKGRNTPGAGINSSVGAIASKPEDLYTGQLGFQPQSRDNQYSFLG